MPILASSNQSEVLNVWEAYVAPTERIKINAAVGRVATSTIRLYPPGIPEIMPGMTYTKDIISNLTSAYKAGSVVIGIDFETGGFVDVIAKSNLSVELFEIKTFTSKSLSREVSNEIADYFRSGFCAAPYYHFAFHEDDPLRPLPASLKFIEWSRCLDNPNDAERLLEQERLISFALTDAQIKLQTMSVDDIELPPGFHQWTDKTTCRNLMYDRLQDPGYVTLVRDTTTFAIVGLLHSRMAKLERLFYSEEWYNPLIFSELDCPDLLDQPDHFFKKMKFHFGLEPQTPVMTISAQIISPSARGGDIFYKMMKSMALCISPIHASLPLLCEIPAEGTAHILNTAFTDRLVFGCLKNSHPLVFCQKTSAALFPFLADKSHWTYTLRHTSRAERQLADQHFVSSSTDNTKISVRENGAMGLAVFATERIQAGECIAVFEGEKYEAEHALALPYEMRDHAVQVGPQSYVFGYRGLAHCLCHSCEPNCGIRNLTEIFTTRDIEVGEQLTWDYRCTENSTWVLQNCLCGSRHCTKIVQNYDSLPSTMKAEYQSKNMVSEWLFEPP